MVASWAAGGSSQRSFSSRWNSGNASQGSRIEYRRRRDRILCPLRHHRRLDETGWERLKADGPKNVGLPRFDPVSFFYEGSAHFSDSVVAMSSASR